MAEGDEFVCERLEVRHRGGNDFEEEAILPCEVVSFQHLRGLTEEIVERLSDADCEAKPDERGQWVAECCGVDDGRITQDHTQVGQTADAFGDRGRRHGDRPGEIRDTDAAVPLEVLQDLVIDRIDGAPLIQLHTSDFTIERQAVWISVRVFIVRIARSGDDD